MSEYTDFLERAESKAFDQSHRLKILRATSTYAAAVEGMKKRQFADWQTARVAAGKIRANVLDRLAELLERFEAKIRSRGVEVLWAEDDAEARQHLLGIVKRHAARSVVKAKSMTTEEIGVNSALESAGVEVRETDLGELIVQLAGERPYHIITPAMHKSRDDIAALFHDRLGAPRDATAEELTMIARAHLRDAYVTADIGISGANFLLAEEGAVVMTENEGNGRLTMACPPVHVVLAGIEKVLPGIADLSFFLPLLATSGTGQKVTCYNSIIRGPRGAGEPDGPGHMYVILLDNGRSGIYARETFRESLRCIRCGACLNACPVYRTIGGHAYNTTYPGPIGAVITPHLRGMADWGHLSQASSLCGACTEVCPVGIDLHHLLLENRWDSVRGSGTGVPWRVAMKFWALVMTSRRRVRFFGWIARWFAALLPFFLSRRRRARMPRLARRTFSQMWSQRKRDSR